MRKTDFGRVRPLKANAVFGADCQKITPSGSKCRDPAVPATGLLDMVEEFYSQTPPGLPVSKSPHPHLAYALLSDCDFGQAVRVQLEIDQERLLATLDRIKCGA